MNSDSINPDLLSKIPLFESLNRDELQGIIDSPDNGYEEYEMKQRIIREEEIGDCMYVLLDGTVEVSIKGDNSNREITIATLRKGDFFGEQALLPHGTGRRNASVVALHPTKLFRIDKKHVQLSLGGLDESEDITVPAEFAEPDEVRIMLGGLRLFQSLKPAELDNYRNWTDILTVGPGEFVLKENDTADSLFVILDGHVEVFMLDDDGKIQILSKLAPGEYFGEQALMPGSSGKRNAYARTDNQTRLIKVPKAYFKLLLKRDSILAIELLKKGQAQLKERLKH